MFHLRTQFRRKPGAEILHLEYRANFDFGFTRHRVRAALQPFDGLIDGLDLPNPEARDEFLGFGERTVDDGTIWAGEPHALAMDARAQPLSREKHACFDQ